jgi:hypothetical protein
VSAPGARDPAPLTEHYEALRSQVLSGSAAVATPLGLAVLLRRGLAGWLAVCIELMPAAASHARPRPASRSAAILPVGVHGDAVRVLASMALAACQTGGS